VVEEDDTFDKCVHCIITDLLPSTPNKKKTKKDNFNVEEFTKLTLSEEEQNSVTSVMERAANDPTMP